MTSIIKKSTDRDTGGVRLAREGDKKSKKSKTIIDHEVLVQSSSSTLVKRAID